MRDTLIEVRWSAPEAAAVRTAARTSGLTVSEYIRQDSELCGAGIIGLTHETRLPAVREER